MGFGERSWSVRVALVPSRKEVRELVGMRYHMWPSKEAAPLGTASAVLDLVLTSCPSNVTQMLSKLPAL